MGDIPTENMNQASENHSWQNNFVPEHSESGSNQSSNLYFYNSYGNSQDYLLKAYMYYNNQFDSFIENEQVYFNRETQIQTDKLAVLSHFLNVLMFSSSTTQFNIEELYKESQGFLNMPAVSILQYELKQKYIQLLSKGSYFGGIINKIVKNTDILLNYCNEMLGFSSTTNNSEIIILTKKDFISISGIINATESIQNKCERDTKMLTAFIQEITNRLRFYDDNKEHYLNYLSSLTVKPIYTVVYPENQYVLANFHDFFKFPNTNL